MLQPDLCVICDPTKLDARGCLGAPDLVAKVISEGNTKKEMRQKFKAYEEAGVREYWIIHPSDNNVFRFQLNHEGQFIGLAPLTDEDCISSVIFYRFRG